MTPLVIAALAFGGLATVGTAAIVLAGPAKKPETPKSFTDPEKYFAELKASSAAVLKIGSDRAAESDARVATWKKDVKYIPVVGDYAGYLIDLGNWLGKKLGSNYAEQNSDEDLQRAADMVAVWIQAGYVPPVPLFTAKDGAKFYADDLDIRLRIADGRSPGLSSTQRDALQAIGLLTIKNSGTQVMKDAIGVAASGNGSLRVAGSFSGKMAGAETIIAGIVACEFSLSYEGMLKYALEVSGNRTDLYGLSWIADCFMKTMQFATIVHQGGEKPKPKSDSQKIMLVAGCSSCTRPFMPRTNGFFT